MLTRCKCIRMIAVLESMCGMVALERRSEKYTQGTVTC